MDKKQVRKKQNINRHILNVITPSGIDYDKNSASVGDNEGKIYAVTKYPTEGVDYGWLAPLCNLEGSSTVIEYRYTDSGNMTSVFNKRIRDLKTEKDTTKDQSVKLQLDKAIDDLNEMIKRISVMREPVGYINVMIHVQDTSQKELNERIKRVNSVVQGVCGCNLRPLKYKQLYAMECMAPYGIPNQMVANIGQRNVPISSFIGGFPMANTSIYDPLGYFIGEALLNNALIVLDMWKRGGDRTNSNWFISGVPGVGKSTFVKLILLMEYAFGTKIIVFDPEQEYIRTAKYPSVNGNVINGAGGKSIINPLQIRKAPRVTVEDLDENEEIEKYYVYEDDNGISDMAFHIQSLRIFFKLYFGAKAFDTSIETALEKCLIETYEKFGITWDTDITKLAPEQFPILSDLYATVEEKCKDKNLSDYRKNTYDKLIDLLYKAVYGADQFMWNGHTTMSADSLFNVINASNLVEADEKVKRAQFFNITMWAWQIAAFDRKEKVLMAWDELYLFLDPEYPELMKYLRNVSKRLRKYEGSLMVITHDSNDVLDPEIRRFGQAIIDNSCYKFIMGTDGQNLLDAIKLYNLHERERNILAAKNRGEGILFAGSVRIAIRVIVKESYLKIFGKAGGR